MAQQTSSKSSVPQGPAGAAPHGQGRDRLRARNLTSFLLCALLLHLLFFGLSAFSGNLNSVVQVTAIPVELVGVADPGEEEQGGGDSQASQTQGESEPAETEQSAVRPQNAKVQKPFISEPLEQADIDVSEALAAMDTNSKHTVYRRDAISRTEELDAPLKTADIRPTKRKSVSIADVAARAAGRGGSYGLGRGKGGGRGGLGDGFGAKDYGLPVISGGAVFGSGRKGALKGFLCFLPVGTKRLSDVSRCKPEGVLYTNMLNISPRRFTHGFPGVSSRFEWFGIDYNGRFTVSEAGEYKFRLHSDDGSLLWINGAKVIDNDGTHPPASKVGKVYLEEGKHRIRVFYFQGPRTMIALQLFVEPPGEAERLWSPKL